MKLTRLRELINLLKDKKISPEDFNMLIEMEFYNEIRRSRYKYNKTI